MTERYDVNTVLYSFHPNPLHWLQEVQGAGGVFSHIFYMTQQRNGSMYQCTGSMVGRAVAVTAAHWYVRKDEVPASMRAARGRSMPPLLLLVSLRAFGALSFKITWL